MLIKVLQPIIAKNLPKVKKMFEDENERVRQIRMEKDLMIYGSY